MDEVANQIWKVVSAQGRSGKSFLNCTFSQGRNITLNRTLPNHQPVDITLVASYTQPCLWDFALNTMIPKFAISCFIFYFPFLCMCSWYRLLCLKKINYTQIKQSKWARSINPGISFNKLAISLEISKYRLPDIFPEMPLMPKRFRKSFAGLVITMYFLGSRTHIILDA